MDPKLIRMYPDTQLCARCTRCLQGRTDSKRSLVSNSRLILILSVGVAISIMISVLTMCMYIHLQVRVSLHDADLTKLQTDYQILTEKYNAIVGAPVDDGGVLMAETVYTDPGNSHSDGSDSVASTLAAARRISPSSHNLVKRQASGKKGRKKRHKKKDRRVGNRKRDNRAVYFNIRGKGTISGLGVFQWDPNNENSVVLRPDVVPVLSDSGDGSIEKVKVMVEGFYSISVQINVQGRRHMGATFGPVGYWICKESRDADNVIAETILDKVFLTQDERGEIRLIRGGRVSDPPVDSLSYSNTLFLERGDRIYVKRPEETRNDNTIIFDNSAASAHFTGHFIFPA